MPGDGHAVFLVYLIIVWRMVSWSIFASLGAMQ